MSMPDLLLQKCNPKNALRKASETPICNMLSYLCCILNARLYVCTDIDLVPSEPRFDTKKASPGCIVARQLIAKVYGVPEESIQFSAGQLYFTTDNMAVFASWFGHSGDEGISDKGMTDVVTKEAASNTRYNCHFQRNTTRDLNGLKVCITNTMAAGGDILQVWAQVIGFTGREIPQSKVPSGFIILKVPRLSASINENSFGYIILMQKGVGIKTAMFAMYKKVVIMPKVSRVRCNNA